MKKSPCAKSRFVKNLVWDVQTVWTKYITTHSNLDLKTLKFSNAEKEGLFPLKQVNPICFRAHCEAHEYLDIYSYTTHIVLVRWRSPDQTRRRQTRETSQTKIVDATPKHGISGWWISAHIHYVGSCSRWVELCRNQRSFSRKLWSMRCLHGHRFVVRLFQQAAHPTCCKQHLKLFCHIDLKGNVPMHSIAPSPRPFIGWARVGACEKARLQRSKTWFPRPKVPTVMSAQFNGILPARKLKIQIVSEWNWNGNWRQKATVNITSLNLLWHLASWTAAWMATSSASHELKVTDAWCREKHFKTTRRKTIATSNASPLSSLHRGKSSITIHFQADVLFRKVLKSRWRKFLGHLHLQQHKSKHSTQGFLMAWLWTRLSSWQHSNQDQDILPGLSQPWQTSKNSPGLGMRLSADGLFWQCVPQKWTKIRKCSGTFGDSIFFERTVPAILIDKQLQTRASLLSKDGAA